MFKFDSLLNTSPTTSTGERIVKSTSFNNTICENLQLRNTQSNDKKLQLLQKMVEAHIENSDTPVLAKFSDIFSKDEIKYNLPKEYVDRVDTIISSLGGIDVVVNKEIMKNFIERYKSLLSLQCKVSDLYNDIEVNEGALFSFLMTINYKFDGIKMDTIIFNNLLKRIRFENHSFFPLRDYINNKFLKSPNHIYVPSLNPSFQMYNGIDTACATLFGDFVFNFDFCELLIGYAKFMGLKGSTPKYESNGGDIPDEYCLLETVITHEYLHFVNGDMLLDRIFGVDAQLMNLIADFRINYILYKSGYAQLPIGLISKKYNMDTFLTYRDMINHTMVELDNIKKEMDKPENKILFDIKLNEIVGLVAKPKRMMSDHLLETLENFDPDMTEDQLHEMLAGMGFVSYEYFYMNVGTMFDDLINKFKQDDLLALEKAEQEKVEAEQEKAKQEKIEAEPTVV